MRRAAAAVPLSEKVYRPARASLLAGLLEFASMLHALVLALVALYALVGAMTA